MSGDVTYQALDRLTYLADRDALKNGNVIAGQPYYDIYFTGGAIANVTLTDCTINGLVTTPSVRVVTGGGDITALNTDNVIVVDKDTGAATTVFLPAVPADSQLLIVKDGKGDANSNNITLDGNGGNIDGGSTLVIGSSYGWNQLIWNGTQWNIIG